MTKKVRIPLVVHPFLFAVFPVIALFTHNAKSLPLSPAEMVLPLAASLIVSALLFLLFRVLLKDPLKAGLCVTILALWFFSFGHIVEKIAEITAGIYNRSLFFASLLLVALLGFLIIRSARNFRGITKFLNIVSVTLIVLNVLPAARIINRSARSWTQEKVIPTEKPDVPPNIYYLVLDGYTRKDILEDIYGFDNSPFLDDLKGKGFYVASSSYSNYAHTHLSLASFLNFSYLDPLVDELGVHSSERNVLVKMIQENQAMAVLKSQGYELFCITSGFEASEIQAVDRYIAFKRSLSEFQNVLLNTTPLPLFLDMALKVSPFAIHRDRILKTFSTLQDSVKETGPFFLFVHLMCPHPPFVFGPNGEPIEPDYYFTLLDASRMHGSNEADIRDYIVDYRNQLAFLNGKLRETIDVILAESTAPCIFIIHADHGGRVYLSWEHPEASYFKENLAILNTLYFPDGDYSLLHPGLSPVNNLRVLFDKYFGTDLGLLEDRSFFSTWSLPYKFIPFEEGTYQGTVESARKNRRPAKALGGRENKNGIDQGHQ